VRSKRNSSLKRFIAKKQNKNKLLLSMRSENKKLRLETSISGKSALDHKEDYLNLLQKQINSKKGGENMRTTKNNSRNKPEMFAPSSNRPYTPDSHFTGVASQFQFPSSALE
jgi:hypothetical protein